MAAHGKDEAEKKTPADKHEEAKEKYDEAKKQEAEHRAAESEAPTEVQPENVEQNSGHENIVSLEGQVSGSSMTLDPAEASRVAPGTVNAAPTTEAIKAKREADREEARVQFKEQRENTVDSLCEVLDANPDLSIGQVVIALAGLAGKSPRSLRDDELDEMCGLVLAGDGTLDRPY